MQLQSLAVFSAFILIPPLSGCTGGSVTLKPAEINAGSAAAEAIKLYDGDGDGQLSLDEAKKSPALAGAFSRIDSNGDKRLSADEIAARIRSWSARGTAIVDARCRVMLDGRPLAGAEVVFDPEPFLGGALPPARGQTDETGLARPALPADRLPNPNITGIAPGFYSVRIQRPENETAIPARYNQQSELGQEIADDSSPGGAAIIEFRLKAS